MGDLEPLEPKPAMPSVEHVKVLIKDKEAGFALIFLGALLIPLFAIAEPNTKILLAVGAGLAFVAGVLLVAYKERNTHQLSLRTLKQQESDYKSKAQLLEKELVILRSREAEFNNLEQQYIKDIEVVKTDNQHKDDLINQLQDEIKSINSNLNERKLELTELSSKHISLEEKTQPEQLKKSFSHFLYNLINYLLAPERGRSTALSVSELFEEIHSRGYFTDDHFQDAILKVALYEPPSED